MHAAHAYRRSASPPQAEQNRTIDMAERSGEDAQHAELNASDGSSGCPEDVQQRAVGQRSRTRERDRAVASRELKRGQACVASAGGPAAGAEADDADDTVTSSRTCRAAASAVAETEPSTPSRHLRTMMHGTDRRRRPVPARHRAAAIRGAQAPLPGRQSPSKSPSAKSTRQRVTLVV